MIEMDKLTLAQAQAGHVALWDWLAETPRAHKLEWPGWAKYDRVAENDCFTCEISRGCGVWGKDCPIEWPGGGGCCTAVDGSDTIYLRWLRKDYPETRKALAAQIRDLPWRGLEK